MAENTDRDSQPDAAAPASSGKRYERTGGRTGRSGGGSWFTLIVAAVVMVGVFFIVNSSFSGGMYDYSSLAQLHDDWSNAVGREIQVTGTVVPGSIRGDVERLDVTFDIEDGSGQTLTLHFAKILPDPFAEGRHVIASGTLGKEGPLEVDILTVKCPSRYQDGEMTEAEANEYYEKKYEGQGAAPTPK